MSFKGISYKLNQCKCLFEFIDNSSKGEYMDYYDKIVFHTESGFVAAYRDDLNNYWRI